MSNFTEFQTKLKANNDRIVQSQLATRQQAQAQTDQAKQERTFKEVIYGLQAMVSAVENSNSQPALEGLATLLGDIKTSLAKLTVQETPDVSTPIVEAVNKLEAAIKAAAPPQVNVAAPEVSVTAPKVDLSGIQKVLSKDIPQAFNAAIAAIPQPGTPEPIDFTPILDSLADIGKGVRMVPQFPVSQLNTLVTQGSQSLDNSVTYSAFQFDPDDSAPIYIGKNVDPLATNTIPTWMIYKFTYSGANVTSIIKKTGAWSSRVALFS